MVEVYSSLECAFAYQMTYRLRQLWPEYRKRVRLVWRALPLEYVNREVPPPTIRDVQIKYLERIDPEVPIHSWTQPSWTWPTTFWTALEALACAQAQGDDAALEFSWVVRHAYFAENRNVGLRHELFALAEIAAADGHLSVQQFERDWDGGRYKGSVLADSRRGWHDLQLESSATCVLSDGRHFTNPGIGLVDFDHERQIVRSYLPVANNPLTPLRAVLEAAATA